MTKSPSVLIKNPDLNLVGLFLQLKKECLPKLTKEKKGQDDMEHKINLTTKLITY